MRFLFVFLLFCMCSCAPKVHEYKSDSQIRVVYHDLSSEVSGGVKQKKSTPKKVTRPVESRLNESLGFSGPRVALVIGNGDYTNSRLKNPVNDAMAIADALRDLNFKVIERTNIDLRQMNGAIDQFSESLREAEVGLVYFAGHGMQIEGENYLIPVKANISSANDIPYEAVPAGKIVGRMEDVGTAMNILILDACRNNPFRSFTRGGSHGLAKMDAPMGTIIIYSTSPGTVAADGEGRNGTFTKHLLENIKSPGLDINGILINTRKAVIDETKGKQIPWESSSLTDYFYFLPK